MINLSRLSLDRTPPLWVPLQFMAVAPLFGVLFAGVMILLGPQVLVSRWMPGMIGAAHLLVLGYVAIVMFGAMQQMLPVVAGSPVPRGAITSRLSFMLLTLGTPLLGIGLVLHRPFWIAVGGVLVLGSLGLFTLTALIALARSQARGPTTQAMTLAVIALLVTAALGGWLAGGHLGLGWPLPRHMTDLHLAWGLLGWVALLVAGAAYQVVPMFQMTPEYPALPARLHAPLVFAILAVLTLTVLLPVPAAAAKVINMTGSGMLAALMAGFAGITLWLQSRRRRRNADVTVRFWHIGMVSLLAAVLVWVVIQLLPGRGLWGIWALVLAWLFVAGFAVSVINGMLYKIVPFLVWLHLNQTRMRSSNFAMRVPNMHEVIPLGLTRLQLRLHLAALVAGLTALAWPGLLIPAMLLFAASNGLLSWNLFTGIRCYRASLNASRTTTG
ncbi:hypothetical protein [Ectothiorhodospira shaposhnikovii]|uniref:hypothetical protein n=1 Tax=Ectothiorhodospira shaposhnikovii TaxID=1054 RepID=UPI001EE93EDF|nr:hypothetical protein [Ectothiorhodospira shaposhnikovii]MCG5513524.1 hypothetical protein [Ectothiorhodospira shaposhnikovii]